jgi:hypothetical protein
MTARTTTAPIMSSIFFKTVSSFAGDYAGPPLAVPGNNSSVTQCSKLFAASSGQKSTCLPLSRGGGTLAASLFFPEKFSTT